MKEYCDYYARKARAENYPARSVYKLKEIAARFRIFRKGAKVLDLGAAPGSWTLGALEAVGQNGLVLACDLQSPKISFPRQVIFMVDNVLEPSPAFQEKLADLAPFDIVLSDMAPATSGARLADQARSLELAQMAFSTARKHLKQGGNFVVKIFMGPDIQELLAPMRKSFKSVKTFKPKSSRSESYETFFIGLDFSGACAEAE